MDTTSFVRTLELEECCDNPSPVCWSGIFHANETREGFVDAGSVVCFASDVQLQQRDDVLESTLLAQLAANKKYDRFSSPNDWYKFYDKVMAEIGWRVQSFQPFSEHLTFPDTSEFCDVVVAILSKVLEEKSVMLAKDTFDRLAKSLDGLTLFNSNSSSLKNGNFQIVVITLDKNNQINAFFLGSYFKSSENVRNYFFEDINKNDVHLFKSAQVITLDEDVYAPVREEVKKKLGQRVKGNVINIHIG